MRGAPAGHGRALCRASLYFRVGDGVDEAVVAKVRGDGGNPDDQIAGDVAGAVAFLTEQSHATGEVGVIGFCSGGRETYLVACRLDSGIDAAIDCWGGNVVVDDPKNLTVKKPVAPIDLTDGIKCNAVIARAALALIAVGNSHGTLSEIALGLQFGRPVLTLLGAPEIAGSRAMALPEHALAAACRIVFALTVLSLAAECFE